jgi:23S rRNA (adenine2503-C2)-methyltransferase
MPAEPIVITDLACTQFDGLAVSLGVPLYRAKQIRKWVYVNLAAGYEEMTDLPAGLRQKLSKETVLHSLEKVQEVSSKDGTVKVLFKCADGNTVEAALMFYGGDGEKERRTVCVSTQAGCSIGCPFCATGRQGFQRNLTPGEIVDQVLYFARSIREKSPKDRPEHISNVVFMGMGEPLLNYDNLWQAIETLNSAECFKLGARNMTISTSGVIPGIKRLGKENLQVGLAVSLHAADNGLRNKLVPLNHKYPLETLIPVCREYVNQTSRRVSFEYILFQGINSSIAHARELAGLVQGFRCHVNLIPANQTENPGYAPPPLRVVVAFENELKKYHINVTLRQSRGQDVEAGCGQLRSRYLKTAGNKPAKNT